MRKTAPCFLGGAVDFVFPSHDSAIDASIMALAA